MLKLSTKLCSILLVVAIAMCPAYAQLMDSVDCPPPKRMLSERSESITIRFVGDLVLGNSHIANPVPKEWEKAYFADVGNYLQRTDVTLGNLEGALTDYPVTPKNVSSGRAYAFRFPTHYAGLLKDAGFSALNIANNHSNDFGEKGFADTLQFLRDAKIAVVGLKNDYAILPVRGLKVAIVGFGFYPRQNMIQDLADAGRLLARARADADYVIATFHGGAEGDAAVLHANEAETYLSEDRGNSVAFAHAVIDAGADAVVGHGPHVLRSIECYKGRPVFYSLGNFVGVGGLSARGLASITAIAGVQLDARGTLVGIEFLPIVFDERKVPKVDVRDFASHLINWSGKNSRFAGHFLSAPAVAETRNAFEVWLDSFYKPFKAP